LGAPRRDTTMTQDSDSGDAVGDAGPTTDRPASWASKVKNRFMIAARNWANSAYLSWAYADTEQVLDAW